MDLFGCGLLKEVYVFSIIDGMVLEVFVVEGWYGDEVSFFLYYFVIFEDFELFLSYG